LAKGSPALDDSSRSGAQTEAPEKKKKRKFSVDVNLAWCKGCQICVHFCPVSIIEPTGVDNKVRITDQDKCTGCMQCEMRCPDFAIYVRRREED
jgi:2-oxoglutarate ferredoxin oxidoreductase subunit delta